LKLALGALADLGLLQRAPGKKPRYFLQRGSPLWNALELGCTDLLTVLIDNHRMKQKPTKSPRFSGIVRFNISWTLRKGERELVSHLSGAGRR